ncbi:MAG: pyruvate carboxylase subunit B [Chloroflexi bacterium]|nr:pyruvate carboxylase subunit B [Chloroflexota bacterium]
MPVKFTDTTLRDAHQSLLATRMSTEDMLPIAEKMDRVGFHSMEVWGGATFDTAMRFLQEDPWERLRQLKAHIKKTPLQMLLRGQNIVGYQHYPDDVVEHFVDRAKANGIDIFRIFDALNDVRNMEKAMASVKAVGGHVQGTICYTISPVHDIPTFARLARTLAGLGADSICIKDMAGLLAPYTAYVLVKAIKDEVRLPLQLHCHYTSGMASMAYIKGIEAGADIVDTALSTMSLGLSQPPVESLVSALQCTPYETPLDMALLAELADYFAQVRRKLKEHEAGMMGVDGKVLLHQIPGGMVSNLMSQLREQKAEDKLPQVLEETARVRAELGYPPLVTPTSQIVGTQAVLNVVLGERYQVVPKQVKDYVRGMYGKPPAPVQKDIQDRICEPEEVITCRPADLLPPVWEKVKAEAGGLARTDDDLVSYALFPQVASEFLHWRDGAHHQDEEVVAAIAVALAQPRQRPKVVPQQKPPSPWKLSGRQEIMRGAL